MARWLSLNEIKELPYYKPVWIQYGTHSLEYDTLRYNAEKNEIYQDYAMAVYNEPDINYRHSWVAWDSMPSEEEFFKLDWRIR